MQTIRLSISIQAPKQTIWDALHRQLNLRESITAFSHKVLDKSNYLFKQTPWGDEMLSQVVRYSPIEVISIKHEAVFNEGRADYWHSETKNWNGLYEIYRLSEAAEQTVLDIEADCSGKYAEWIQSQIQKTLDQVKQLSEQMPASIMSN